MTDRSRPNFGRDTVALHAGRDPDGNHGVVNPPVYHCSTVIFKTVEDPSGNAARPCQRRLCRLYLRSRRHTDDARPSRMRSPALEGGYRAVVTSCGLGAIAASLTAFLKAGDHLLIVDSLYGPARAFCEDFLKKFGVEVTYYPNRLSVPGSRRCSSQIPACRLYRIARFADLRDDGRTGDNQPLPGARHRDHRSPIIPGGLRSVSSR